MLFPIQFVISLLCQPDMARQSDGRPSDGRPNDGICHKGEPSPELLAAQRRLEQLRSTIANDQWSRASDRAARGGWQGAGGTWRVAGGGWRVARDGELSTPTPGTAQEQLIPAEPEHSPLSIIHSSSVSLHPSLALGMLQAGQAAAGRIWLLLRYLDKEGSGRLRLDLVQEYLTAKDAELRICGRRQLRNLLKQGGGLFWKRDKERVWLNSAAKVAASLGVERLAGRPVKLPVTVLLGGIGQVRAHFYASFHSGRYADNPISRGKLKKITHVPERTQRIYDQESGVRSTPNFAVGERYKAEHVQERAWRHGRGTFNFVDQNGRFGPAGTRYVAWRLPNSYKGPHEPGPRGRQKKINRQIDLVNLGAQGNDLRVGSSTSLRQRLFHQDGPGAARTYNREPMVDVYWSPGDRDASRLWHVIPGRPAPARTSARVSKPAINLVDTEA